MFAAIALSLLIRDRGIRFDFGRRAWTRLALLGRRFLPVQAVSQALAFGALWG